MPDKLYSLLLVDKGGGGGAGGLPFKSATTLCRIRGPLRQCLLLYLPLLLILVVFTVKTRVKLNDAVQFSTNYLELNEAPNQDFKLQAQMASEATKQQERRQQIIKDYCQSKLTMDDDAKMINYVRKQVLKSLHRNKISTFSTKDDINFVSDKNSQWAYCHVPKAASTTWMLALAQINQVENFTQLMNEGLLHGHMMHEYGIPETKLNKEAFTFTFLRHPFERLVSAYHEKFVIRQEMNFIQPVIDWEAGLSGRLVAWFDLDTSKRKKDFNMNFEKFVHFVIHELETNMPSYGSLHWWPFSRLCGLCHIKYDFIGKVETLQSDVEAMAPQIRGFQPLQKHLFSVKFNKNRKEESSKAYFSQLDSTLIMQLYSLFEDDFQLGNYDYPTDYLNLHK